MNVPFARLTAVACLCALLAPTARPADKPEADLVDTAVAAGNFRILARALETAGLVDALRGEGPFTVLAPTDVAFGRLPEGTVESLLEKGNRGTLGTILAFHVIPGRIGATDLARGGAFTTLQGQRLRPALRDGRLTFGDATVVRAGIACRNGVIHVVDRVLMPETRSIVERLAADGRFSTLVAAAKAAGLAGALGGSDALTVFAPTDEAFAALPEGTVAALLEPARRDDLARILKYHVVAGRAYAADAYAGGGVETLAAVPLTLAVVDGVLRVDGAGLVEADLEARNGVIHAVDAVLMPPAVERDPAALAAGLLSEAIDRGVPIFNRGDEDACAAIYAIAARGVVALADGEVPAAVRDDLARALRRAEDMHDAADRAWELRRAMDRALARLARTERGTMRATESRTQRATGEPKAPANDGFEVLLEAPLPKGFPAPGPVGEVVVKRYPAYRAARASGSGNAFWTLFGHIKKNEIAMTAPVEMGMEETNDGLATTSMAFLYERPQQGEAGRDGSVDVVDLPGTTVLSIGLRGPLGAEKVAAAKQAIESAIAQRGGEWVRAGDWRMMGYNSPMVPATKRFYEIQLAVRSAPSR